MNEEIGMWEESAYSESLSRELERDARRYDKAFTEEDEVMRG